MKVERAVRWSLLLIQVIDARQPVKPENMQDGIEALNALMTRWEADTVSLGWSNVDNPSDDMPTPDEATLAVVYNLAMLLAPQFGVTPLKEVAAGASVFLADLLRDQAVATPIQPILDAPQPDRWNRNWHSQLFWEQ